MAKGEGKKFDMVKVMVGGYKGREITVAGDKKKG